MELLKKELIISKISAAVFVPCGSGAPIHKNRAAHGLAMNIGCNSTYRFESGEVLVCHSGECIYLPRGSNYTVDKYEPKTGDPSGTYAINFLLLDDDSLYPPFLFKPKGKDELLSAFMRAESARRRKSEGYAEECFIDLYRIIKQLKKESAEYYPEKKALDTLAPAIEYINNNYTADTLSLARLAELCGISEQYLRRLFKSVFSTSPSLYVRNLRIKYAKELLRSGEYSVTEAAAHSGFNDVSYFSREFKKATGVSPKEFCASQKTG